MRDRAGQSVDVDVFVSRDYDVILVIKEMAAIDRHAPRPFADLRVPDVLGAPFAGDLPFRHHPKRRNTRAANHGMATKVSTTNSVWVGAASVQSSADGDATSDWLAMACHWPALYCALFGAAAKIATCGKAVPTVSGVAAESDWSESSIRALCGGRHQGRRARITASSIAIRS
jgi:hypothetical protein